MYETRILWEKKKENEDKGSKKLEQGWHNYRAKTYCIAGNFRQEFNFVAFVKAIFWLN